MRQTVPLPPQPMRIRRTERRSKADGREPAKTLHLRTFPHGSTQFVVPPMLVSAPRVELNCGLQTTSVPPRLPVTTSPGSKEPNEISDKVTPAPPLPVMHQWIRTSGAFDGMFDFDAAVRDPRHPEHFLEQCDSGDHLHPSAAGFKAMARAVDISALRGGIVSPPKK